MALNIGKKMVYLLALSSFTLATWGISLFSNPLLTPVIGPDGKPKEGSWQEIDQRKAKIEAWVNGKRLEMSRVGDTSMEAD